MTEESRANDVRPYNVPFPKRVNNSSALPGISSKRGDNGKASSLEEVASRRLDGGVSGERCSPLRFLFSKRVDNSSALPGISSMRGDNFAKPPLQRRWPAAGLTEESRANNVRPYGFSFRKGWTTPLPCRASPLEEETILQSLLYRGGGKPQA